MNNVSIYRGYVTDRKDPKKMGRLKVKVPMLWGDEEHDYWAFPKGLFSGNGIGLIAIPEVDDMVWVSFEGGIQRYPVWEYGHWLEDGALKDAYDSEGEPTKLLLKTKEGHIIAIDGKKGEIEITHASGPSVKLDEKHISLIIDGDKAISLGKEKESAEPAVLGDKAMNLLIDFMNDIGNLGTITTSSGVTGLISTSPQWANLVAKWNNKWTDFKSKKTTLD